MVPKKRKRRESFGAIRQRSSGRYQASYVGPDGERHNAPQTFDGITDARGWLAVQQARILDGTWSEFDTARAEISGKGKALTFGTYAEDWISTRTNRHGDHLRPRTAAEYRRLLAGPLRPFADSRLTSITPDQIRSWYSALIAAGTKTQAARAYELLKSILTTAVADGRIKVNPCQIRGAASASTGKKTEPPTPSELQAILNAITPRFKAAAVLAAWTGVRYGELTELRRRDVEIVSDAGSQSIVVKVSRGVTHVTGQGFIVGPTKSEAGVRAIVLPPHVNDIVTTHLNEFVGRSADSLLFPSADGSGHLAQSAFWKHWNPARIAAGRQDMPWHALRHYGATRAALAGATLKELQSRLGHSTVAAAMRYQHTAGRDEELARRMSELA
ncbi:site-specific integrase [Microbacterium sp. WCS2018Hpa-9]|uniref:tyrosine-type recombinase/integrase n=1 Tax=Microbacterium sp. WCS2018Hpa-9 TaxID=3073635 RepID=UPI00288C4F78|nr:site-specific integrase [Microbacterium sp. WCS2018Hpa-9]